MAKTQVRVENYNTASRTYTNDMTKRNGVKRSDSSSSTHSSLSRSDDGRRTKVATSMRKFLSDDDEVDYLGTLTSGPKTSRGDISKHSTSSRRRTPPSYRKKTTNGSDHKRLVPRSSRRKAEVHEGSLDDVKESARNIMSSARKLVEKAARAASPGRLRRDRSKSPGPQKTRNSIRAGRSTSPMSSKSDQLTASPNSPSSSRKKRSKSPGRLKKRVSDGSEENGDAPKSSKGRARSKSPGKMKKRSSRSQSPGRMKKRSQSPGALRRTDRPRRRPENRDDTQTSRRRTRSHSNGPLKKSDRPKSTKARSRRGMRSTRSNDDLESESGHQKQESYSNMQEELNRYKVKRNKSMDAAMTHRARLAAQEIEDEEDRCPPRRANSMMLSREKGRRGKSNSLADLVQYQENEIHSTSYFASNHVLVNRERMKRGLRPLTRNIAMDDLARKSAEAMAESNGLNALPTTYVGNVLRGETIRTIHRSTMLQKQGRERSNILNPYFQDFGVGTCKGSDGQLYMCQLFSERLELALTDTKNLESSEH
eukprot:CAMPEP_0116139798 /NCGR_PEP_ID=MMETSP0329-20121206/13501_1 /TAXON_ID=697910 /ORGANISM="Pseudo-nitzschia arenysensis, Strain B593" /LENGTH=536 /DNA_ID=CAMNT_0003634859 /DNA_START=300 /DNA_END=1910 /DNA_ORIENTATION=+